MTRLSRCVVASEWRVGGTPAAHHFCTKLPAAICSLVIILTPSFRSAVLEPRAEWPEWPPRCQ